MATVLTPFNSYTISYKAKAVGDQMPTAVIDCYRAEDWVGQLQFYPSSANLSSGGGLGSQADDFVVMYFSIVQFADVVDVLRNEGPLVLIFDTEARVGSLTTVQNEPVGELEIVTVQ